MCNLCFFLFYFQFWIILDLWLNFLNPDAGWRIFFFVFFFFRNLCLLSCVYADLDHENSLMNKRPFFLLKENKFPLHISSLHCACVWCFLFLSLFLCIHGDNLLLNMHLKVLTGSSAYSLNYLRVYGIWSLDPCWRLL